MSPVTMDSRVKDLEIETTRLKGSIDNLSVDVKTLTPLNISYVGLSAKVENLKTDFDRLSSDIKNVVDGIKERDKTAAEERKSLKVALFSLSGIILSTIIGGIVTLVAAGQI